MLSRDEILFWLHEENPKQLDVLFERAYQKKIETVGKKVYFRGIIEFSNYCVKNCYYCGIRRENTENQRFEMSKEEILECAEFGHKSEYGSLVLQSGERQDEGYVAFVEDLVRAIKERSNGELGITLSCGEQSIETYRRWFDAGAHRYLIRVETTNPELYARLHPADHTFEERLRCLEDLRACGYQVGTGGMIGLPGQSYEDLADDLEFYRSRGIDMIGMGPYIVCKETPLASQVENFSPERQLLLGLKMIALARLHLGNVNIAATTALQALDEQGREKGLQAGANILMPNITHAKYRKYYQLYDDKPCIDENASLCRSCLSMRILGIGETIGYSQWGDSPYFMERQKKESS